MEYNIHNGDIRQKIHDFLFDGNSMVCSIFHHLPDIRKTNKIPKKMTLKMVKIKENNVTQAIRLEMYLSMYM